MVSVNAFAGTGGTFYENFKEDSILPEKKHLHIYSGVFLDVLDVENNFVEFGNTKRTMKKLLRIAGMKKMVRNNTIDARILFDLANISTRLKMYPLAIKCYDAAIKLKKEDYPYSSGDIQIRKTLTDPELMKIDSTEFIVQSNNELAQSPIVKFTNIENSFQDGKSAVSYAIIVHVKQPIPGKRKAFYHINNVGHTFITLVKLNDDNSSVSRSFGFYPAKRGFLSATPIHPDDDGVIKDDVLHPWDETIAKFISEKKFNRILTNLEKYSHLRYNLNRNNCTDFGLTEALAAGIDIQETGGKWPLGKGNNPANAGQSLLEKKFSNNDPENPEIFSINEGRRGFDDLY